MVINSCYQEHQMTVYLSAIYLQCDREPSSIWKIVSVQCFSFSVTRRQCVRYCTAIIHYPLVLRTSAGLTHVIIAHDRRGRGYHCPHRLRELVRAIYWLEPSIAWTVLQCWCRCHAPWGWLTIPVGWGLLLSIDPHSVPHTKASHNSALLLS